MTILTMTADSTNYAVEVIEVKTLLDLPGLDNLKGLPIGGFTALVSKDTQVGDILIAFPAESQIEDWFPVRAEPVPAQREETLIRG